MAYERSSQQIWFHRRRARIRDNGGWTNLDPHPEAVRALVLVGPYADGRATYSDASGGVAGLRMLTEADAEFGRRTALQGLGVSTDEMDLYMEVALQTADASAYPLIAQAGARPSDMRP